MSALATLGLARVHEAGTIACMSRDLIEAGLGWSWREPRVMRCIRDRESQVVVARHGAEVVAFAIMHFGQEAGHLNLLAVDHGWRRQGLGRRLIEWLTLTADTAGIGRIDLELRKDNDGARAFYERLGFAAGAVLANYYAGMEPALKMSRSLLSA